MRTIDLGGRTPAQLQGLLSQLVVPRLATWWKYVARRRATVPVLLASFRGQFGSLNYGLVMAASAIASLKPLSGAETCSDKLITLTSR